jgi:hypothetical protein
MGHVSSSYAFFGFLVSEEGSKPLMTLVNKTVVRNFRDFCLFFPNLKEALKLG